MKKSLIASVLLSAFAATVSIRAENTAAPAAAAAVRTVSVTANDQMKFNLSEIRAKTGEKIKVTLKNEGSVPKAAMAHNWVLLKPMNDEGVNAFSMAAMQKAPEYLPADKSAIVAHTKLLGPGESDTVEFTAPAAGQYPFICSFPGHSALMKGKLIVE